MAGPMIAASLLSSTLRGGLHSSSGGSNPTIELSSKQGQALQQQLTANAKTAKMMVAALGGEDDQDGT